MKVGDLVRHMDGRIGIVEWAAKTPIYPSFVTVVIPWTGDNHWWDIDLIEVISEIR